MSSTPDLTGYKALSFDCYGTLIDWETGLITDLQPILSQLPPSHEWNLRPLTAVEHFDAHSRHLWKEKPTQLYEDNLAESFSLLATEAGVSVSSKPPDIATGPSRWEPFPDTIPGLQKLQKHYKLIILSNVSNRLITSLQERHFNKPPYNFKFDAILTAEQIGSYKPSHNNFHYLFNHAKEEFNVDWKKGELLHVARSLDADHVPAKELDFPSVWISRGGDKPDKYGTGGNLEELNRENKLAFLGRWDSIGDFADEVERQFAAKEEEKAQKKE
ncbi:HAD-like domain containing protein [Rhypophila decipiens]